jgi:hypothetical protein
MQTAPFKMMLPNLKPSCRSNPAPLTVDETRRARRTVVPAIVAAAGDGAARRFLEFFAVTIDNPNTRAAYFHGRRRFFAWCDRREFAWCDRREDIEELVDIEPMHAAAYIRGRGKEFEKADGQAAHRIALASA